MQSPTYRQPQSTSPHFCAPCSTTVQPRHGKKSLRNATNWQAESELNRRYDLWEFDVGDGFLIFLFVQVLCLIEKETRAQSSCRKWFSFRAGRVTASCAKAACSTSIEDPSPSLVQRICYPSQGTFTTVATTWGIDNEPRARAQYVEAMTSRHANFKCNASGVHISFDHQFLAATPDGVVSCDCCGTGVLEVKCPYSLRDCTVIELTCCNSSSITLPDGDALQLKRKHAHFWQVQMQMFVCQVKYADYVVWTTKEIFIERIFLDDDFCARMLLKSTHFFKRVLLPELR